MVLKEREGAMKSWVGRGEEAAYVSMREEGEVAVEAIDSRSHAPYFQHGLLNLLEKKLQRDLNPGKSIGGDS